MPQTKRLCCFFNCPSHYRKAIYKLIDENYDCMFILGDEVPSIKEMDCSLLKEVKRVHYGFFHSIVWISGVLSEIRRNDIFLVTPATNSITHWFLAMLIRLHPSKKLYFWTHGYYGKETKRQLFFKKAMFSMADGLFLYGDYAKGLMIKDGFSEESLHVVHNSLDYQEHIEARKKDLRDDIFSNHFGNNLPVAIVIGRLNKRKKLDLLLKSIASINNGHPQVNVVLIGDGEDREKLENQACSLGIENNVWFYGSCYDEMENAKLLYNSDICVVPGDIGLTAIHAMTFGVPVISHNYFPSQGPEFEVIEPDVTGDFFENDNESSLTAYIEKWVDKTSKGREDIREACFKKIDSEWTPEFQLKVFKEVL